MGVSLAAIGIAAAGVGVDAFARVAARRCIFLASLPAAGAVLPVAVDFDFSQRQRSHLPVKLDANITAKDRASRRRSVGQVLRQAEQQWFNLRIETGSHAGVRNE